MRFAPMLVVTAILALLGIGPGAAALDLGGILKNQAKQRTNRAAEEAVNKGLDVAEEAARCVVTDEACIEKARGSGQEVVLTGQAGESLPADQQGTPGQVTGAEPSGAALPGGRAAAAADRFTSIIEQAPESTVVNGMVVNNKRVAVQKELSARPPTREELGVAIPKGARLELETTARQIAQYHPNWRIYKYTIRMPVADLIRFFTDQGLSFDPSMHRLRFPKPAGNGEDFIDSLEGDPVEGFRIWRRPRDASVP